MVAAPDPVGDAGRVRRSSFQSTPWGVGDAPEWLVADPDPAARSTLERLVNGRVGITVSPDGAEALWQAGRLRPSVVVLSATLPVVPAAEVARVLAGRRDGPASIVVGIGAGEVEAAGPVLAAGANRVVSRPYQVRDVEPMVREHTVPLADRDLPRAILTVGALELNGPAFEVLAAGRSLRLSLREFELLWLLMQHVDTVVPHQYIRERLWGSRGESVHSNTIAVHIRRLRTQLAGVADILTVRSLGYRLRVDDRTPVAEWEDQLS